MYWRYGLQYFGNTVNGIRISCSALFISILYRRNGAVMCMKFILRNSRNPSKHFNYYNDFKWRQSRESIKLLSQRCLSRSEQHSICNCVSGLLFKGGGIYLMISVDVFGSFHLLRQNCNGHVDVARHSSQPTMKAQD